MIITEDGRAVAKRAIVAFMRRQGGNPGSTSWTTRGLGRVAGVSTRSASRMLEELAAAGTITRVRTSRGCAARWRI